jgi:sterol desaturase/sphingolipid hydroxylase (fatty acid hydroxylase superfamily)/protein-tyrosine-phosphatase
MDFLTILGRMVPVLSALAIASVIEAIVPLRRQSKTLHGRIGTNLALLVITLSLGVLLNFTLALGAAYAGASGFGLLAWLGIGGVVAWIVAFLALDAATYLVHRILHRVPWLWRVHLTHHTDAAVDATTAFRQHPVEGVLRFSFIAATAWLLALPPAAIALYRLFGALNSVLEHSNIRFPPWFDRILVTFWVSPDMHKVHHSRHRPETDSNYANLFSFFDRLFGTYTDSRRGRNVAYGIEGHDGHEQQSLGAVLWLPFKRVTVGAVTAMALVIAVALSGSTQADDAATKQVVFVCEHGAVKSMMAAEYFNRAARERRLPYVAVARGVAPDSDRAPPAIVASMKAEGFDVERFRAVPLSAADVDAADRVITIGTSLPQRTPAPELDVEQWQDVPPASTAYSEASDALHAHVEDLVRRLATEAGHQAAARARRLK